LSRQASVIKLSLTNKKGVSGETVKWLKSGNFCFKLFQVVSRAWDK